MVKLVTSLIFSRLDYCTLLCSPDYLSRPYHLFSAFRMQRHDSSLSSVHVITWFPRCVIFTGYQWSIALPTNSACSCTVSIMGKHNLTDTVTATLRIKSRFGLRSASSDRYEIPWSRLWFGECRFSVAGPKAWNNLPTRLHQTRSTVTFKWHLKSVELFEWAYISLFLFHYF